MDDARPISLQMPKVWASPVLTTPLDDVYDCTAVERTPLVYCLILTTYQASTPFIQGAHFIGGQIYMMIRCGSRESAVNDAFYAAGANGWNVAFSCVMRLDENHEGRTGIIREVKEPGMLAKKGEDESVVRLFY
jgi:hypothetical protein